MRNWQKIEFLLCKEAKDAQEFCKLRKLAIKLQKGRHCLTDLGLACVTLDIFQQEVKS